ncbi:MAG: radical SAM protein, partial [Clostridia bacterium]|nr:radical SAM protein [Clostridia bacterium]
DITNKNMVLSTACNVCPRACNVSRFSHIGYCKSKGLRIARYGLHHWEEPCISGTQGSGTIFFSGCSLRCIYCQNYEVSQLSKGYNISVSELIEIFKKLEELGANNINLVTPTHYIDYIIMALDIYRPNIPICYNSSGYESVNSIHRIKKYIDSFLVDFKYIDSNLALQLSKAKDYPEVAKNAIMEMKRSIPQNAFNKKGLMTKGIIVRHLVLPENIKNSKDILSWIVDNLGKDTIVSIMNQYTPYGKAIGNKDIGRKLKPIEYKIVVNHALRLGLNNAFVQEDSSASEIYIPQFDGEPLNL